MLYKSGFQQLDFALDRLDTVVIQDVIETGFIKDSVL
jgi:hypothetical protein